MSELIIKNEPPLIDSGLFPDLKGVTAPLFVDGRNVHFRGRSAQPIPGQVPLFGRVKGAKVTGIHSQLISGLKTVFFGYIDSLYMWDVVNGIDLVGSGYTGQLSQDADTRATFWSMESWGNFTLAVNGIGNPQYRTTTTFGNLGGSPPTACQLTARRSPFMLLLNNSNGGAHYDWCDADAITTWTPSSTNRAGGKEIRDMGSDIVAAKEFRSEVLAIGEDSMHLISFLPSGNLVFGDQRLLSGIGCVGKNACVTAGNRIFGWGNRGIWVSDGTSFEYADTIALKEFIYSEVDQDQLSQICAYHDRAWQHIAFFAPQKEMGGVNSIAFVYNYREQSWTIYDFGRSVADDEAVYPSALLGTPYGDIMSQNNEVVTPQNYGQGSINHSIEASATWGYGESGYGEGGYGGELEIDG